MFVQLEESMLHIPSKHTMSRFLKTDHLHAKMVKAPPHAARQQSAKPLEARFHTISAHKIRRQSSLIPKVQEHVHHSLVGIPQLHDDIFSW
jgi:hypothetical protein